MNHEDTNYEYDDETPESTDHPTYIPDDCSECGCLDANYRTRDWQDGVWVCPQCGSAQ